MTPNDLIKELEAELASRNQALARADADLGRVKAERDAIQHLSGQQERHRDELLAENERLRATLQQFATCDLNESNCSGLPVAVARIRNIARAALAGSKHD